MRTTLTLAALAALALLATAVAAHDAPATQPADHRRWINDILDRMDNLKPGTTYAEFTKTFDLDGGLQPVPATRFGLRDCPAIKVDVTFKDVERGHHPTGDAKIASISKPYLERPYMD